MSNPDSKLVKDIRKLERMGKKATLDDVMNLTAVGYAAETIDHVSEAVNDAWIEIEKIKKTEAE